MQRYVARYWEPEGGSGVRCTLCPHACRLREGQRGLCFVRANEGGAMVLGTYGRSSGICVDPIEKKPLSHFLPGSTVLSFGTAGCNLTCRFCQNADISRSRDADTLAVAAAPEQIADLAAREGCRSVAYTYNDPVIFLEYAVDTARACAARGIHSVAVTAGYILAAPREEFFAHMDAANIDLKAFTARFYRELCGVSLDAVKETLVYVARETPVWLEVTTLLIPGENDSDEEIDALTAWHADALGVDVPLHFTAFHPAWRMLDRPATPVDTLRRARARARANGLRHVYLGNVRDADGGTTTCHACGAALIERIGYQTRILALRDDGSCTACGTRCAGVFDASSGHPDTVSRPVRRDPP